MCNQISSASMASQSAMLWQSQLASQSQQPQPAPAQPAAPVAPPAGSIGSTGFNINTWA